ncbi:MAG: tRNA pseudouridine(38-40) synthase TruA [Chloroflexota bacterium]
MARYQVILSYDGTAFHGMQRQLNARSVQGEVETALKKIGWQASSILAAGRTDAGVHAEGQVVAFDFDWQHSLLDLKNALNAALPGDAAVQEVQRSADEFHPRYDALARTYRYQIFCQPTRDPLRERYAWRVWPELDLQSLKHSAQLLVGEHDFAAFGTPPKAGGITIRQVFSARWQREADAFSFEVSANAYLYHMVRRMVSIQVEIGQGRQTQDWLSRHLKGDFEEIIQGLAPAHGLFLTHVQYPPNRGNETG